MYDTFSIWYLIVPSITGAVGWLASWFVNRKKDNNDFLNELLTSIDNLTGRYTTALNELVEVKKQNAELLLGQEALQKELKAMRCENKALRMEIDKLNETITNIKSYRTKA